MSTVVLLNGSLVPPEAALVSVFDRQFLYGDGIYETVRTFGGRIFLLNAHLRRLRRSASGTLLPLPFSDAQLRSEAERSLAAAGNAESTIRIMVTRGEGEFGLDPTGIEDSRLIMIVRSLNPVPKEYVTHGVDIAIPSVRRTSPRALASHIKSGNYLNQALALAEGRRRGAYEVIMLDEAGHVTEGSTSNVFFVHEGVLHTPAVSTGVLPGMTRALVLGLAAQLGIPTARGDFPVQWLLDASEAFLTATIKEIMPIRRIDGSPVGKSIPGDITQTILARYQEVTQQVATGTLSEDALDALLALGQGEEM